MALVAPAASGQGMVTTLGVVAGTDVGVLRTDSLPVHSLTPRDTFLGPDKVKHFLMSAFIEDLGFGGLRTLGTSRGVAIGVASAVTVAAGVGREIHDGRTKGLFSFGDLTWDALGLAAGVLVISHSQR